MLIGYARVSTTDQNLTLQKDALEKAGCERIYEDELSGLSLHKGTKSDKRFKSSLIL